MPGVASEAMGLALFNPLKALAVALTVAFVGLAFPYGVPLFTPLAGYTLLCLVIQGRMPFSWNRGVVWLIVTIIFLVMGALLTTRLEGEVRSDLVNAASILILLPALADLRSNDRFDAFLRCLWRYLAVALGLVSLVALLKLGLWLQGTELPFVPTEQGRYPWGSSLTTDYNFFAFGMLTGTVAALAVRAELRPGTTRVCLEIFAYTTVAAGLLAGSRRYWVVVGLGAMVLAVFAAYRLLGAVGGWLLNPRFELPRSWAVVTTLILMAAAYWIQSRGVALVAGLEGLIFRLETLGSPATSLSSRFQRWSFAVQLLGTYSVGDLMVGRGFDYLTQFADRFVTYQDQDYPHNLVVAALLYSGVPGAIAVVGFLADASVQYFRHLRRYPYLSVLFFAAVLYIMPSMNSLFSAKFLPVLLLLPWLNPPDDLQEARSSDPLLRSAP